MGSEIQDAVAVVRLFGSAFIGTTRLGSWFVRHSVEAAAALKAWNDSHKFGHGEVDFQSFMKRYGERYTLLKFPTDLKAEEYDRIVGDLGWMGVSYTWMPFPTVDKMPTLAIPAEQSAAVKTLFERYRPKEDTMEKYWDSVDLKEIEINGQKEIYNMNYQQLRDVIPSVTLQDEFKKILSEKKMKQYDVYTINVINPRDYIKSSYALERDKDGMALFTKFDIYKDRKIVKQLKVRNGSDPEKELEAVLKEYEMGGNEKQWFSISGENDDRLIKYYFLQYEEFCKKEKVEKEKRQEQKEVDRAGKEAAQALENEKKQDEARRGGIENMEIGPDLEKAVGAGKVAVVDMALGGVIEEPDLIPGTSEQKR